ncbi:hypothetical protein C0993_002977 [Termitomyces sp. T159_Od127]|nr:hypothetical protein C0993_002977 [Termitomyces sp. T159_Od127]
MSFHRYAARRTALPTSPSSILNPMFRERCLMARIQGAQAKLAGSLIQPSIIAAEHKETLTSHLKALDNDTTPPSTISSNTDEITFPSNQTQPIAGETFTSPDERGSPTFTAAGLGSVPDGLTHARPGCTYTVLEELEKEVESQWRTPIDTHTDTSMKPFAPFKEDAKFVSVDLNTMPAVLDQSTDINVKPEDIDDDDFVVITTEGEYTFTEQPNVIDDDSDWIEVDA